MSPFQVALKLKLKLTQKLVPTGNYEADANDPVLGAGVPEGLQLERIVRLVARKGSIIEVAGNSTGVNNKPYPLSLSNTVWR